VSDADKSPFVRLLHERILAVPCSNGGLHGRERRREGGGKEKRGGRPLEISPSYCRLYNINHPILELSHALRNAPPRVA